VHHVFTNVPQNLRASFFKTSTEHPLGAEKCKHWENRWNPQKILVCYNI